MAQTRRVERIKEVSSGFGDEGIYNWLYQFWGIFILGLASELYISFLNFRVRELNE